MAAARRIADGANRDDALEQVRLALAQRMPRFPPREQVAVAFSRLNAAGGELQAAQTQVEELNARPARRRAPRPQGQGPPGRRRRRSTGLRQPTPKGADLQGSDATPKAAPRPRRRRIADVEPTRRQVQGRAQGDPRRQNFDRDREPKQPRRDNSEQDEANQELERQLKRQKDEASDQTRQQLEKAEHHHEQTAEAREAALQDQKKPRDGRAAQLRTEL